MTSFPSDNLHDDAVIDVTLDVAGSKNYCKCFTSQEHPINSLLMNYLSRLQFNVDKIQKKSRGNINN